MENSDYVEKDDNDFSEEESRFLNLKNLKSTKNSKKKELESQKNFESHGKNVILEKFLNQWGSNLKKSGNDINLWSK